MRASRLLSVLLLLQARGRMTAQELADELEVSVRTVYRDVDALGEAGVPVYAERGSSGGYRLLDGYRTRLTGLSTEEAEALFLAGIPHAAADLGLGTVLAAAQLKLTAALPAEMRPRVGRIAERFHLDAPGFFRHPEQVPHLAAIASAVWTERRIRLRYTRWGGEEVARTLDPLGIVLKAGVWYLVAGGPDTPRTYRMSRIAELEVLDDPAQRPADFDLGTYWQSWSERFERGMYRGEAVLRLSRRGRELAGVRWNPVAAQAARAGVPGADGWAEVVVPIESVRHALGDVLSLGAEAEVLAPAELRERVAAAAQTLAERYS